MFFAQTSQTFPTYQCLQKGAIFCLDLELLAKMKMIRFLHTRFTFLSITQDLNKIKKLQNILL